MKLPVEEGIGPCTLNIGVIEGGRAPNVIPDKARAQLLYRLVGPSEQLKREIVEAVGDLAQVEFVLEIPFVRLRTLDGLPTMVAAFTTDIPALSNWGQPLLVGPGSIHVAHTDREYVEKKQLQRCGGSCIARSPNVCRVAPASCRLSRGRPALGAELGLTVTFFRHVK